MIDTRCYNCMLKDDTKYIGMNYEGKGVFKCPECIEVLDLHEDTFSVDIERVYDDEGETVYTVFLKLDERLDKFEDVEEDLDDLFDDLSIGKYRCDVFYHWDESYEGEWDLEQDLLSYEEMEGSKIDD